MASLQKPPFVWMNGGLTRWDDANVHIGAEALIRGISVFEGIKGYWDQGSRTLSLLELAAHYERLTRSAALQHLPFSMTYEDFAHACTTLVGALMQPDRDLWLRPTVLPVEGHWGLGTQTELVITCYNQDKARPAPISVGISTWQRPLDNALPATIKSAANYQTGRLARIEGRRQGHDDMILLNQWGRVAEATGSCVLMVSDCVVVTPPTYEGCLRSITVNVVERLCRVLDIPFERRPIDRSELLVADEVALAGTLMEVGVLHQLDSRKMPEHTPVLDRISAEFWSCVRNERAHPAVSLTPVPAPPNTEQLMPSDAAYRQIA